MCDRRTANIWTARFMPVILTGMVGYATYVFVVRICIHYLLHPPAMYTVSEMVSDIPVILTTSVNPAPRTATAIGLMVGYLVLLLCMGLTYFRLVYTILTNPGYTPQGANPYGTSGEGKEAWAPPAAASTPGNEKTLTPPAPTQPSAPSGSPRIGPVDTANGSPNGGFLALSSRPAQPTTPLRPALSQVFLRDTFLCDSNGEVRWCGRCGNYKPDRAHHCSEVGRCVENFDHFCPWVGGVVGLTSYKFFVQFVAYGSIFCIYSVICVAVFFQEKVSRYGFTDEDGHWVAVLAMGGFFGLFINGMFFANTQMIYWGSTTIENFDRKTKRYFVARLDPNQEMDAGRRPTTTLNSRNTTRAPQARPFWQRDDGTRDEDAGYQRRLLLPLPSPRRVTSPSRPPISSVTSPNLAPVATKEGSEDPPAVPRRYYKLYLTPSGLHPWRVGFKRNFKLIMGPRLWDWLLPVYRPYHRPRSRDSDGELAEGVLSGKELSKQMLKDGWAPGSKGAAMAREGGVNYWYEFSDEFIKFMDSCDEEYQQRLQQ
ncbi:hypothetical protein H072_6533 [Dactylellina haptotyla CBS 200.50]|uniref:Palmitoyltransferase n=1 Tax=Dactylellina haptotyla (strain CBS 200.50) TaxID=1284197 RepID=S8A9J6_DACHA|nr:hypothetical protein H072_6533 [Dactylellina haptotyla CBS 200.50]